MIQKTNRIFKTILKFVLFGNIYQKAQYTWKILLTKSITICLLSFQIKRLRMKV